MGTQPCNVLAGHKRDKLVALSELKQSKAMMGALQTPKDQARQIPEMEGGVPGPAEPMMLLTDF